MRRRRVVAARKLVVLTVLSLVMTGAMLANPTAAGADPPALYLTDPIGGFVNPTHITDAR